MIKNCNNSALTEKNIDEKYFLFYQVWKELTDSRTLDTYQYRIMNTLSALQELCLVIVQRLNRYHNSNHNIEECKAETLRIIKNDSVMQEFYPIIWRRLIAHLSEKMDTEAQQRALRYQIEYCYNYIRETYIKTLVESLESDIENANERNIIVKANQVVSNCASLGWSTTVLHGLINTLNGSKTDTEKWVDFKTRILSLQRDRYHILMPLKVRVNSAPRQSNETAEKKVIDEIIDMGIEVKTSEEIGGLYSYVNKIEKNQKYLVIEVEAYDYYAASHMAIGKVSTILNLLSFYNWIEAWNIRDISWCSVNVDKESFKFLKSKDLYETYDYLEGANRVFRGAKTIDGQEGDSLQARLRATYSYANMGKASYAQTEKYINTWVALESLCRTDVYDNIISNVLETVPQALCLRYIYQKFRNFIEDCNRCNLKFDFSTKNILLNHPSKKKIIEETIEVLRDSALYAELKDKCKVNNLLLMRCEEMHEIATNHDIMFSKIEKHYINVKRQLSRLYRLRNEIAHTAMNDEVLLIRYIEHLDDYLASFVSEVVVCANNKNEDSIEIVLEIIKDNYREFCAIKNAKKGASPQTLLEDLLKTGVISLI